MKEKNLRQGALALDAADLDAARYKDLDAARYKRIARGCLTVIELSETRRKFCSAACLFEFKKQHEQKASQRISGPLGHQKARRTEISIERVLDAK